MGRVKVMKNCVCDSCKKQFTLTSRHIKEKEVETSVGKAEVTSIVCPFCREEYVITAITSEVKSKMKEYQKLLRTAPIDWGKINTAKAEVEAEMDKVQKAML